MKPALLFIIAVIALLISFTEEKSLSKKGVVYYSPYRGYYPSYYYPSRYYYPTYSYPHYYYRFNKKGKKVVDYQKMNQELEEREEMNSQIRKAKEVLDTDFDSREKPLKKQVRKLMNRLQRLLK